MSKVKKQIGDQVMITAGQFKNRIGKLVAKESHGWKVELDDGLQVAVSFPMVALVQNSEQQTETENSTVEGITAESTDSNQTEEPVDQGNSEAQTKQTADSESGEQDITKMTVKELQTIAKQRGIGIARTKSDFLRIIKEKNPDEDLDQLVGKTLFNRISELHISRLRTKADLVRMLSE